MASLTLNIDAVSGWDGVSQRSVNLSISSDSGSGTASYTIHSTSSSSSYPYTRIWLYVNGTLVHDSGYGKDYRYYPMARDASYSDTCSCPTSGSFLVELKIGVGYDYVTNQDSGYLVKIGTPSISTPSISNIGRTSASASASMTDTAGGSQVDFYIDCATNNFSNVVSTISSTSGSFSGLQPNTTYYVRANGSNGTNRGYSSVTSFKTTGNAPSISSVTTTPSRTGCSFSINVSYDTNDSFSSRTIQYGTTTSYGSSTTGTSISGLSPNTTYYYKVTITSTQGRSGTYTGNFKTTGNPPTIGSRTITQTFVSTAINSKVTSVITYSTTYDSSSFGSHSLVYGTTTSYGSSATSGGTGGNSKFTLNNLLPNTTYYYKITETDSDSLSSTATGSFTTKTRVKVIKSDGTVTPAKVRII